MVRPTSQQQCSSPTRAHSSCEYSTAMADEEGAFAAAGAAASGEAASASSAAPNEGDDPTGLTATTGGQLGQAATQAVGSEPTAASCSGLGVDPGQSILDDIASLRAQQKKLREDKKALSKNLRNAEKRRSRLKKRAKALTDADLLAVISLRAHEKALGSAALGTDESDSESEGM